MNKCFTPIKGLFIFLLITLTTLTHAQTATGNKSADDGITTDIVNVSFNQFIPVRRELHSSETTMGFNDLLTTSVHKDSHFYDFLGVGLEADAYPGNTTASADYFQILAGIRWYLGHNKNANPFFGFDGGISLNIDGIGLENNYMMYGFNFGERIVINDNTDLQLSLGVRANSYGNYVDDTWKTNTYSVSVPFTVGVEFK